MTCPDNCAECNYELIRKMGVMELVLVLLSRLAGAGEGGVGGINLLSVSNTQCCLPSTEVSKQQFLGYSKHLLRTGASIFNNTLLQSPCRRGRK